MWQRRGRPPLKFSRCSEKLFDASEVGQRDEHFFSPPNTRVNKHFKYIHGTVIKWDENSRFVITITRARLHWKAATLDTISLLNIIWVELYISWRVLFIRCPSATVPKPCSYTKMSWLASRMWSYTFNILAEKHPWTPFLNPTSHACVLANFINIKGVRREQERVVSWPLHHSVERGRGRGMAWCN